MPAVQTMAEVELEGLLESRGEVDRTTLTAALHIVELAQNGRIWTTACGQNRLSQLGSNLSIHRNTYLLLQGLSIEEKPRHGTRAQPRQQSIAAAKLRSVGPANIAKKDSPHFIRPIAYKL